MYPKRNNELEIISLFKGNYLSRFYLREIHKLTKIPLKTCQNTLLNLENNNILKSKVEGKNKYFFLNLENIQTKYILQQAEIYRTNLFINKYPIFKMFLKSINSNNPIIIFGSFAKFNANENSDLDLMIISKEVKLDLHLLPFKIHKINMTEKIFLKALNQQENLIKEMEENHIILNNHSFYINIMWSKYAK